MPSSTDISEWIFVSSRTLVSALGLRATRADSWWRLVTMNRQLAGPGRGVVIGVTARNEFPPLLQIAQSQDGKTDDYNPTGLTQANLQLLVPPALGLEVAEEADRLVAEEARQIELEAARRAEAARWEAGREVREKATAELMAPVKTKADKYRLNQADLLSPDLSPNWLFAALLKDSSSTGLSRDELLKLKKSGHLYFAAAAYWHAWEDHGDPWDAVQACSLLRLTNDHKKALVLSRKLPSDNWDRKVKSALWTTRGGAMRDLGELEKSWHCAQDALKSYQDSPHPFMLLGALCYQTDRHAEGDTYFRSARERGATDRQIEVMRADAKERKGMSLAGSK